MLFDDLEQTHEALTAQVTAGCAALATLRQMGLPGMLEKESIEDQWVFQLRTLMLACVILSSAAESLFGEVSTLIDQVPLEGRSEALTTLLAEWQAQRGLMPVGLAGRRGGSKVREQYGLLHYSEIGKRGGAKARELGSEHFSMIGKMGGETAKARLGTEHYQKIGKLGGTRLAQQRGPDYYRRIGQLGGSAHRRSKHGEEHPSDSPSVPPSTD